MSEPANTTCCALAYHWLADGALATLVDGGVQSTRTTWPFDGPWPTAPVGLVAVSEIVYCPSGSAHGLKFSWVLNWLLPHGWGWV